MIIFNTTFNIERQIHEHWLKWVKTNIIPKILENSLIKDYKIMRLLTEFENPDATYSIQLSFEEMPSYVSFELNHKDALFERHDMLFRGKFVMFSSLLEEI